MNLTLIPEPPAVSLDWLCDFAGAAMALQPGLSLRDAMRYGALAHGGTWLLEADEAAALWLTAMTRAGDASRLTGGPLA